MVLEVHNMALWYTGYNSMVDGGVRCGCPGSSSGGRWSGCLPAVLGALASLLGVLGGVVDGLHDGGVLGVEGDGLDELVHLVPQLGGSQLVVSGHGGLAGGARHAAQLLLVTPGVQQEAQASGEV